MKNPHVIIGPNNMCLCGTYGAPEEHRPIVCSQVISAIEHAEHFGHPELKDDLSILRAALTPLIVDVDA